MTDNEKPEDDAFKSYKISSHQPLENMKRSKCPKCKASRMYFCYTCYKFVEDAPIEKLPTVELPIEVDIIKHSKELDGKSTAVHAAVLSPNVTIYTYPVIPNYANNVKDYILVFPGENSHPLSYYSKSIVTSQKRPHSPDQSNVVESKQLKLDENIETTTENIEDNKEQNDTECKKLEPRFKKILMVDCTWNQVHGITNDERLKGIPLVELTDQKTRYWRKQARCPDTYLSTIEALHSAIRQYHSTFIGKYNGQYDDLLYFFIFFHNMVMKNKVNCKKRKKEKS